MGLYIRDDTVNALADQLAKRTGKTKTDAVREALELQLARLPQARTREQILANIRAIQDRAQAAGFVRDPNWTAEDEKAFMDELSGGI